MLKHILEDHMSPPEMFAVPVVSAILEVHIPVQN
jgi:hypothetical protein